MNADNRAMQPDSGPALWSYADECLARVLGLPDANSAALHVARVLTPDYSPFDPPQPPISADGGVGGVVINGVDAPENDKMEWLGYQVSEADAIVNPNDFTPPPSALEKRLSRLGIKGVEASPHGKGGVGIKVDDIVWAEGEYALYQSLPSAQRRTVWMALKGMNVTADQPSCGDLELLTGVSHTTCAKVLPLYRETHGL